MFPRILSGTCTARECPPLVAVVAVVVLLLLCKLHDMIYFGRSCGDSYLVCVWYAY